MVNVDTVYQRVLALANKEQRGYITPQEFNTFANQAQKEILDQYFYDISQFNRVSSNSTEYSDILGYLDEKLSVFKKVELVSTVNYSYGTSFTKPSDFYRVGSIYNTGEYNAIRFEEVDYSEYKEMVLSPLTRPTVKRPVYYMLNGNAVLEPSPVGNVTLSYKRKPNVVKWGYIVLAEKAIHDPNNATNFDLHASEETELVYKILKLSGITLNKPGLAQTAQNLEQVKEQKEKQ